MGERFLGTTTCIWCRASIEDDGACLCNDLNADVIAQRVAFSDAQLLLGAMTPEERRERFPVTLPRTGALGWGSGALNW